MGFGRFICVGLPFGLTIASLVFLLIAGLSGIVNNSQSLFVLGTKDFSMSITEFANLTSLDDGNSLGGFVNTDSANLTAANLHLADSYTFYLWSFSSTVGSVVTKNATKFDYASAFDVNTITKLAAESGLSTTIPSAVKDGLTVFAALIKWTEVVLIIAAGLSVLTLVVGLFGFCSKIGSCCTYLICGIATTACIAFAVLGTVTIVVVKGFLVVGSRYGITSDIGATWLGLAWAAVAFSLAAGLFWLFSACCCSSSSRARKDKHRSRAGSFEKPYTGYQRVQEPYPNQQTGVHNPLIQQYPLQNVTHKTGAYEPYSHHAV